MREESKGPRVERVELSGEYDLSRKREVAALLAAIPADVEGVVVDMGRVNYVDSSFLNELGTLRKRLAACPITIVGANAQLKRIFGMLSFEKLFAVVDEE